MSGAAGNIEDRERRMFGRVERRHQRILPGPMQPERHQIVHQVVAPRHTMEDVIDQRLFFPKRHLLRAKMSGLCHRSFLDAQP
jgi:hypothetical protein